MERDKAYLYTTHSMSFRRGIPGEIIGVEFVKPSPELKPRLCYHVRWADQVEDFISIEDGNHEVIPFADILKVYVAVYPNP